MKNIQLLIQNEELQTQINGLLSSTNTAGSDVLDNLKARQRMTEDKTTQILAAADKLHEDIGAARDEIKARKTALAKKRFDLIAASDGLAQRRARCKEETEDAIAQYNAAWVAKADETSGTRTFLCKEAADLYGLKKVSGPAGQPDEFYLGQLPIVELTRMSCEYLAASTVRSLLVILILHSGVARGHNNVSQPRGSYSHVDGSLPLYSPPC